MRRQIVDRTSKLERQLYGRFSMTQRTARREGDYTPSSPTTYKATMTIAEMAQKLMRMVTI